MELEKMRASALGQGAPFLRDLLSSACAGGRSDMARLYRIAVRDV